MLSKNKLSCNLVLLILIPSIVFAQKETYDLVTYTPPAGWVKEAKETNISYNKTNQQTGGWCVLTIVKSTASKGNIDADFSSEWNDLIVKSYNTSGTPEANEVSSVITRTLPTSERTCAETPPIVNPDRNSSRARRAVSFACRWTSPIPTPSSHAWVSCSCNVTVTTAVTFTRSPS